VLGVVSLGNTFHTGPWGSGFRSCGLENASKWRGCAYLSEEKVL
jgi:hypothetical protein